MPVLLWKGSPCSGIVERCCSHKRKPYTHKKSCKLCRRVPIFLSRLPRLLANTHDLFARCRMLAPASGSTPTASSSCKERRRRQIKLVQAILAGCRAFLAATSAISAKATRAELPGISSQMCAMLLTRKYMRYRLPPPSHYRTSRSFSVFSSQC